MKAYVIAQITVEDSDRYAPYAALAPVSIAAYGGKYLVRNGAKHVLEGTSPTERLVVLEFPSVERVKEWYASDAYQAARAIRLSASTGNLFIVEGYGE